VEDVPILREVFEGAEDDGRELRVVEAAAGLLCREHDSLLDGVKAGGEPSQL